MSLESVERITNVFICRYLARCNEPPGYLHVWNELQSTTRRSFRIGLRLYVQSHNVPSLALSRLFLQAPGSQLYSRFDTKTIVLEAWVQG